MSVCRQIDNVLLVPVFSPDGKRISHQKIIKTNHGFMKRFPSGISTKNGMVEFGAANSSVVVVAESFADADAALQLVKEPCIAICAFSAHQIPSAVEYAKNKYSQSMIVLCADNDATGRKAVTKTTAVVSDVVVSYPPTGKDWSEYLLSGGMDSPLVCDKVIGCDALISPPVVEPNPDKVMVPDTTENLTSHGNTDDASAIPESKGFSFTMGSQGFDTQHSYIIKHYLPAGQFGAIYGASASFKSFAAISWAACIATGRPWNGKKVKQGAVIYIAAEGGSHVPKRIRGWEIEHNDSQEINNLAVISEPVYISVNDHIAWLYETVKSVESSAEQPVVAIFLDTLARCFAGTDENSATAMGEFVKGCDLIKKLTGASIIVVHHSGKNGDIRGSSALFGACDFVYKIERNEDDMAFTFESTKIKDGEAVEPQLFDMKSLHLFIDDDGDEVTTLTPSLIGKEPPNTEQADSVKNVSDNHKAILESIRTRTEAGQSTHRKDILNDLKAQGYPIGNFARWIGKLVADGVVSERDDILSIVSFNGR